MTENTGPSVRKCGQTAPHQGHRWQELAEQRPTSWDTISSLDSVPVLTFECRGVPVRARFEAPGYLVSVTIREDPDVDHPVLNDGATWLHRQAIPESVVRGDRGALEGFASNVARVCAGRLQMALDEEETRRTGKRLLTPEEHYRADRRRMDLYGVTPIQEVLDNWEERPGETLADKRARTTTPEEREIWHTGLAPANPGVCRFCRQRIVFIYPQWSVDVEVEPGVDPSVCPRSFELGQYHRPEAME